MKYILAALLLGGFFNMSSIHGVSYPIGSVIAIVIMGAWLKNTIDNHFAKLNEQNKTANTDETNTKDC